MSTFLVEPLSKDDEAACLRGPNVFDGVLKRALETVSGVSTKDDLATVGVLTDNECDRAFVGGVLSVECNGSEGMGSINSIKT